MKTQNFRMLSIAFFCCTLWNTACVNRIDSDTEEGKIPILFSAKVGKPSTKATDTEFTKGDKVSLFAVLSSTSITQKRYIDNVALICGNNSTLIPEKTVFYPEGDAALDFISYYPYQPGGITAGSSTISISVQDDQSNVEKRALSDFMVAKASDITSSTKAVALKYTHKLSKLKIKLTPSQDESIEDMLKANPRIVASGFNTQADYNLEEDGFSNLRAPGDIVASGKWKIEDGALVGKEVIVIPQAANNNQQYFTMDWNGRIYSCPMPKLDMEQSTQCEIDIEAMQSSSDILSGVIANIEDWTDMTGANTNNQGDYATVHLSALSFAQSNIYRIFHDGEAIAEICQEYLHSKDVTSRAITAYPIVKDDKADLTQGLVLQLLDKSGNVHGGTINWDTKTNSFSYQAGTSALITQFYMNAEKKILLEKPEKPINLNIASYMLRDIREGKLEEYPIVKIGTQYWMRSELRATAYQDGHALTKQTSLGQGAAYFKPSGYEFYFYNGEALLAGILNPVGWKIPSENDWTQLQTYVANDASLIKAGDWQALVAGETSSNNNLTFFSANPIGIWQNASHQSLYKMSAFWTWDEATKAIPQKTVFFNGESNTFISENTLASGQTYYKGLAIRCIRE